ADIYHNLFVNAAAGRAVPVPEHAAQSGTVAKDAVVPRPARMECFKGHLPGRCQPRHCGSASMHLLMPGRQMSALGRVQPQAARIAKTENGASGDDQPARRRAPDRAKTGRPEIGDEEDRAAVAAAPVIPELTVPPCVARNVE